MGDTTTSDLPRMLHSLAGQLEAICDACSDHRAGFELRAVIEGGLPGMLPSTDGHPEYVKSFARGYQVTVLMRREEETGVRDPEAWAQDPEEWMDAYEPGSD